MICPALFNFYLDGQLPAEFSLLAIDRDFDTSALRKHWNDGIAQFSRRGAPTDAAWQAFEARIDGLTMDLSDKSHYRLSTDTLSQGLHKQEVKVFYLAIPPNLFGSVADGLASTGVHCDRLRVGIVVEKPLGENLTSFLAIDRRLRAHFEERQIYRMDQFPGKETVQNILAMRFANSIFEPVWNRRYIDHVAVTVAESTA